MPRAAAIASITVSDNVGCACTVSRTLEAIASVIANEVAILLSYTKGDSKAGILCCAPAEFDFVRNDATKPKSDKEIKDFGNLVFELKTGQSIRMILRGYYLGTIVLSGITEAMARIDFTDFEDFVIIHKESKFREMVTRKNLTIQNPHLQKLLRAN